MKQVWKSAGNLYSKPIATLTQSSEKDVSPY